MVNNAGIMDNFEPAGDIEDDQRERVFAIRSVRRATRKGSPIFLAKQIGSLLMLLQPGNYMEPAHVHFIQLLSMPVLGFKKIQGLCISSRASAVSHCTRNRMKQISVWYLR